MFHPDNQELSSFLDLRLDDPLSSPRAFLNLYQNTVTPALNTESLKVSGSKWKLDHVKALHIVPIFNLPLERVVRRTEHYENPTTVEDDIGLFGYNHNWQFRR